MKKGKFIVTSIFSTIFLFGVAKAQTTSGQVIKVPGLDNTLASIISTVQFYSTLIGAIAIVGLGVSLLFSGDDSSSKSRVIRWIGGIIIGLVLIWGGPFIAEQIKNIASSK